MVLNMNGRALKHITPFLVGAVMFAPVVCVLWYAFGLDAELWRGLWARRIPALTFSSLSLVVVVTLGAITLGAFLAWLIERTNMPLRSWFKPLLMAPLLIPCYIIAICYVNFFGMKGVGEKFFAFIGMDIRIPSIYGFWGAAGILILGTYPYVYSMISASLNKIDPVFSEAARCLGLNRWQRFLRVTLPLLAPAFSAGGILAALYVLSDFGVVSMLRYPTFVSTIYEQMSGRYDYSIAAALSLVLMIMTFSLFIAQEQFIQHKRYSSDNSKKYALPLYNLSWAKYVMVMLCLSVIIAGIIIPLAVLVYWFVYAYKQTAGLWSTSWGELISSGINSITVSFIVATVAAILSVLVGYVIVRYPRSRMAKAGAWMSQAGVALPGVLIALGVSLVFSKTIPQWNYSVFALACAFLIHFFAQCLQMTRAGLTQTSKKMEEGARLLGYSPFQSFWHVTRPLLKPALLTAWVLVFLSSMRELPASLLLRPAGFDPLTVKVWIAASEGFYEQAAAPALALIFLSFPLVLISMKYKMELKTTES